MAESFSRPSFSVAILIPCQLDLKLITLDFYRLGIEALQANLVREALNVGRERMDYTSRGDVKRLAWPKIYHHSSVTVSM